MLISTLVICFRITQCCFVCFQDEGIHMFSIGVGLTNLDEIYAIASEPHRQNTILVDSFQDLPTVSSRLVSAICEGTAKTSPLAGLA